MRKILPSLLFVIVILVLPSPAFAANVTNEEQYRAVLIELIETLQKQILYLQELNSLQTNTQEIDSGSYLIGDSVDIISLYSVNKPTDADLIKDTVHKKYFQRVFELFPDKYDEKLRQLAVFMDDDSEYDAYVETIPPNHKYWLYAVSEDIVDDVYSDSGDELIVHELAHFIEYEEIIGIPKPANQTCGSYFRKSGCPVESSYLKQFANEFWTEEDLVRANEFSNSKDGYKLAYEYYLKNKNEHVSGYSAMNPEEDFAETFMFYVFGLPVQGSVAKQKISFMDSFAELRSNKIEILSNI